jgi:hypothetical protein
MSPETIEQKFTVSAPARLSIENISGSVVVRGSEALDDQVVSIQAVKRGIACSPERTRVEIRQESESEISIRTRYDEMDLLPSFFGFNRPCSVDYHIQVPHQTSLEVDCISATIFVEGLEGQVRLKSVSGEISVHSLTGEMRLNTVSGDVVGHALNGPLRVETVSGEVRISGSRLPSMEGNSVSGSFTVETPLLQGPYRYKTISGSVQMLVDAITPCTIDLSSLSGKLDTNLPSTHAKLSQGRKHLEVMGGGTPVFLSSTSGTIRVSFPEQERAASIEAPPAGYRIPVVPGEPAEGAGNDSEPMKQSPEEPVLSNQEILDKIERGELTVEEALHMLRSE